MNTAQELLILAVQTKTRLRSLGDGLCIFPGDGLPEDALRRFRDAEDELAKLVEELFAFELSAAEQEQMGREMYEEFLAREAAELEARGICPDCRGTGILSDDDGSPDEPCGCRQSNCESSGGADVSSNAELLEPSPEIDSLAAPLPSPEDSL